MKPTPVQAESQISLENWENSLDDGIFLLVVLFAFRGSWLRKQIYEHETQLEEVEQGLRQEKHGLEQRIRASIAELRAEVQERQRAELLNHGRNQILEMLAKNEDLDRILDVLIRTVTGQRTTWIGTLHQLEGNTLHLRASVDIPEMLLERLQQIEVDFADAPETAALSSKETRVIQDIQQQRTPWGQLLLANGICSAWSMPFLTPEGIPVGTITTYSLLRSQPTDIDLALLEMACSMAALVFEHQRLHQELLDHAYYDVLTNIPNRRLGEDRLGIAIAQAKRNQTQVGVLWIDLDGFKQINDTHGHPAGDLVLQEVARRLSTRFRGADTVARMGGDEFMIILRDVPDRESAVTIASELHRLLAQPLLIGTTELNIAGSIGISMYPSDGTGVEQLKQNADYAMYQAKFERIGTQSFSPAMNTEALELRDLKEELTRALQEDGFEIDYQPQCKPQGCIVALEALLRFRRSRLGFVPPSRFIPIAEEMRLIVPLGTWVLRNACRQSMEWQRMGHAPIPIAVNISTLQFSRKDFAESVAEILAESKLDPALLELELTESLVMKDFSESARQMKLLNQLGVRIAIDDFGTGYSSLSCLHQLPIDVLKIDRSFIEKLTDANGTRPIVEAIISMGHTLGLKVVAEGVETSQQLSILEESRCDIMQGYFYATALRPEKAVQFMTAHQCDANGDLDYDVILPQLR